MTPKKYQIPLLLDNEQEDNGGIAHMMDYNKDNEEEYYDDWDEDEDDELEREYDALKFLYNQLRKLLN